MRGLILCVLVCCSVALRAEPKFVVQALSHIGQPISLDSTNRHTWWASTAEVQPEAIADRVTDARQDRPGAKWVPVGVPNHTAVATPQTKTVWLRKVIHIEQPVRESLALHLGLVTDSDRTYFNGQLIGQTGDWNSSKPQAYDRLRIYRIPEALIKPGTNEILIHCKAFFPGQAGIQKDHTLIGPADAMLQDYYIYNFREAGLLVLYFTAASYFAFLFVRRRREKENLLFALFAYTVVVYQFLRTQFKNILGWDFLFWKQVEYAALFLVVPLGYYFIRTYFSVPKNLLMRIWDIVAALITAALGSFAITAMVSGNILLMNKLNGSMAQPSWLLLILAILAILIYRIGKRDRDAMYMAGGLALVLVAFVTDIMSNRALINLPPVVGYGFIAFVMSLALILANRFVRVNEEVEDLNRNLETKVTERTLELNTTLNEVQKLKEQQDGDYYLTSLLLKPLNGVHSKSNTVSTTMLMEQKKKFQFRQWASEIGGDVACSYPVNLKGREFTAVINADAMGKSMQGAGGALVLGTVFKNIVARSQSGDVFSTHHPEQWLKECFIELQNVFVSFDGTMLISAVIGLVDNSTGLLYYINAEHPYTVLLRQGQATFVEREEDMLRKIGIQGLDSQLRVGTLQLLPGDVVIMGSDGRDDLATVRDEHGQRTINEDADLFRIEVQRARGDLERIVENLKQRGEVTDDLSLLRVAFDGPARPTDEIPALLESAQAAATAKDYLRAAELLRQAHEANPADNELLFQLALACQKASRRKSDAVRAAELAERVRLRHPEHVPNLVLLSELYKMLGDNERSATYAARAETLGP